MTDYISNYTGEEIDAGIAKANTALQSYEYLNSVIEQAFDEITDEDTEITLNNTIQAKIKMELKGNTEQTTYTGKNLLPNSESLSNTGQYQDVIRFTDLEPSTEYTLKVKGTAGDEFYSGGSMPYSSLTIPSNGVLEFTFTTSSTISDLAIIKNTTATNTLPLTECTLCKGSTATYEPYVGGSSSPSPDYPQDVRVVTGNNSVEVVGKNLFNLTNQTTIINGVTISANGSEITLNGTCNSWGSFNQNLNIKLNSNESYYLSVKNFTSNAPVNFTTPEGTLYNNVGLINNKSKITRFQIQVLQGQTYNNLTYQIQMEKGSTATTCEPYQSQTYPINLGTIELCKIGSYQDYIYKDSGKWYKHSEIGKVVLDGSEGWNYQSQFPRFRLSNLSPRPVNTSDLFCTHYKPGQTSDTNNTISFASGTGYSQVLIHDERFTTKETFNTWLQSNNVTIYYRLETPTNTEITDITLISQLNNLENAMSYKIQTNISQTNANLPFILYASALGKNQ